jgi:ABC-2 type transport system permease protein
VTGFTTLLRKELAESWRTYRWPVVGALFAFVGLSSPLLARFLPEILKAAAGDTLGGLQLPTPTITDAVLQLQKNLGQFGAVAAIVLAMGAVANEIDRGTAAFVLVRPVGRGAFVAAKATAIAIVLASCVALAVVLGWFYTAILFAPPDPLGWLAMGVLMWLMLVAWSAITLLASAVTASAAAAAGIGVVALLGLSLVSVLPDVARLTPSGLDGPAAALAADAGSLATLGVDLWVPVVATMVLIGLATFATFLHLRRREL